MACPCRKKNSPPSWWKYEQASALSARELVAALEKIGFRVHRQRGSHIVLRRDRPFAQTVVPNHRELDQGTLRAIIRQIDFSVDELIELL
jgi:predicted RNA binding protein YcfA (HicA-like mRNA interferase family)